MTLTPRGRNLVLGAVAVGLVLAAVVAAALIWRPESLRPVSDEQIAHAHAYRSTEQLRDADSLSELPQAEQDELRAELETQLEALGRPSDRVLEAADEQGMPVGVSEADYVNGLPGSFLTSARMLQWQDAAQTPEQQAVLSSIAAHRAATALELGADPAKVIRAVPEVTDQDALAAPSDGQDPPVATGEDAHPELALARQLGQARSAAETWSLLPPEQQPETMAWAEALEPLQDSDWLTTLEDRHPSVIDGSPGMPEGFREDPDAARDRLVADLQDTALAQAAASQDDDVAVPSTSSDPGTAVLMQLALAQAEAGQPVDALPGLQD